MYLSSRRQKGGFGNISSYSPKSAYALKHYCVIIVHKESNQSTYYCSNMVCSMHTQHSYSDHAQNNVQFPKRTRTIYETIGIINSEQEGMFEFICTML